MISYSCLYTQNQHLPADTTLLFAWSPHQLGKVQNPVDTIRRSQDLSHPTIHILEGPVCIQLFALLSPYGIYRRCIEKAVIMRFNYFAGLTKRTLFRWQGWDSLSFIVCLNRRLKRLGANTAYSCKVLTGYDGKTRQCRSPWNYLMQGKSQWHVAKPALLDMLCWRGLT